jgi:hypothetical protein
MSLIVIDAFLFVLTLNYGFLADAMEIPTEHPEQLQRLLIFARTFAILWLGFSLFALWFIWRRFIKRLFCKST